jgi:hypothetical protein
MATTPGDLSDFKLRPHNDTWILTDTDWSSPGARRVHGTSIDPLQPSPHPHDINSASGEFGNFPDPKRQWFEHRGEWRSTSGTYLARETARGSSVLQAVQTKRLDLKGAYAVKLHVGPFFFSLHSEPPARSTLTTQSQFRAIASDASGRVLHVRPSSLKPPALPRGSNALVASETVSSFSCRDPPSLSLPRSTTDCLHKPRFFLWGLAFSPFPPLSQPHRFSLQLVDSFHRPSLQHDRPASLLIL